MKDRLLWLGVTMIGISAVIANLSNLWQERRIAQLETELTAFKHRFDFPVESKHDDITGATLRINLGTDGKVEWNWDEWPPFPPADVELPTLKSVPANE